MGNLYFGTYQHSISPIKHSVSLCQFNPSCSQYAKVAINEFGVLKGLIIFGDRFQRCAAGQSEYNQYPIVKGLFYDPPKTNMLFGNENLWKAGVYTYNNKFKPISLVETNDELSFAHSLFEQNDYVSTVLELKRILFETKDTLVIYPLLISTYLLQNDVDKAVALVLELKDKKIFNEKAFILTSVVTDLADLQRWNTNYIKQTQEHLLNDSLSKKFLIYSYLKLNDYVNAQRVADSLDINLDPTIKRLSNKSKSPILAASLSTFLPGAGYLYCGESSEALSAFIINGLLGYSIYSLFKNRNYSSGALVSLISFPFYFGNIVGSANMAENINQKEREFVFNDIRNEFRISFYFSFNYFDSLWNK